MGYALAEGRVHSCHLIIKLETESFVTIGNVEGETRACVVRQGIVQGNGWALPRTTARDGPLLVVQLGEFFPHLS